MTTRSRPRTTTATAAAEPQAGQSRWQQQAMITRGRRGGKAAAARRVIYEARERGEHIHVATGKGVFCAAREQPADCRSPRWEGLAP